MSKLSWRPGRRVAIAGAGPAGLSAALAFLKNGFDVRIFESKILPEPLGGDNLSNFHEVYKNFDKYNDITVEYCNRHVAFAQKLGRMFHGLNWPLSRVRDFFFDHTSFLRKNLTRGYLTDV